ncbi:MAG TPA: ArgE/DapE family deacylase [Vicinamibacterales bacterium]|jgi:acetylornithine deacetylase/succinyl-diaminopimelate desuccinylase family protein
MDTDRQIRSFVAANEQAITDALSELIALQTVNPPGTAYRECVRWFSRFLDATGVEYHIHTAPNGEFPRPSIVGSYGSGEAGLHFHGHYDVVSAQSPTQFKAEPREGRLYGRGSSDMKGGIVAMLFAIRALRECGIRLSRQITVTLVPDEETGGRLGMRYLAAGGLLPRPAVGALMPEPSSGRIWHACRGALTLRVRIAGRSTHGALPHLGVNAFEGMVAVMNSLLELKHRVVARRTAVPIEPPEANRSVMILGGESGSGVASNVVPDGAWFSIERRINPEETLSQVKEELWEVFDRHRASGLELEVETFQESDAAMAPAGAHLGAVLAQTVRDVTGADAPSELCPGVLEVRFFCDRGVPAYGYGPGLLGISHGPDEYIRLKDLFDCTAIYALTAARTLA